MNNLQAKITISSLLLTSLIIFGSNACRYNTVCAAEQQSQQQFTPVQGKVVYVPSGTVFPATATMELSSESLELGQSVCIALSQDFYYNNTLIAPIGSSVNGTVIHAQKSAQSGINGELRVKFTNIVTPFGQMIPISGRLKTEDGTGTIKGGVKNESKGDNNNVIAAAAAGAVAGTILGPLSGGDINATAAGAATAGAAAGTTMSIWDKGKPAVIPAGSTVNIVIDQQITFTPQQTNR